MRPCVRAYVRASERLHRFVSGALTLLTITVTPTLTLSLTLTPTQRHQRLLEGVLVLLLPSTSAWRL